MKLFSRHYGTERFFIIGFTAIFLLVSLFIYSLVLKDQAHRKTLSEKVIYTKSFTWSRTSDSGEVVGVYSNEKKTRVFMMLKCGGSASIDANDYQLYMKGYDSQLLNKPVCTVYCYGNTGYVGIYLTDVVPFEKQVSSIIIRDDNAASIVADDDDLAKKVENDQSFHDHNQIRLYMNFGGDAMEKLPELDKDDFDPVKIYASTIRADEFASIKKSMIKSSESLYSSYKTMMGNRGKLGDANVAKECLKLPYYIANDRIDTYLLTETDPKLFDDSMVNDTTGGFGTDYGVDYTTDVDLEADDSTATDASNKGLTYEEKPGDEKTIKNYYYLHTEYLWPGTMNIDWQSSDMNTDFLALAGFDSYEDYKHQMSVQKERYDNSTYMPTDADKYFESFRFKNAQGYEIDESNTTGSKSVSSLITTYKSSVNNYISAKYNYLTTFSKFYDYKEDIDSIYTILTLNNKSDNIVLY